MYCVYIDDSGDDKHAVFSALLIHDSIWKDFFYHFKSFRSNMRARFGIYMNKEWHATDFVAGRGKIGSRTVPKGLRNAIYQATLLLVSNYPKPAPENLMLINAKDDKTLEIRLFERLLNRIQATSANFGNQAIIFCDEGKELEYTRLLRKMGAFNPIPSKFGTWLDTGSSTKNITTTRIIEDIVFKNSAASYFVQLADFCAFALFRNEEILQTRVKYHLDQAFNHLIPVCFTGAFEKDPRKLGIIRAK